eukprot:8660375-Pyramimonas_sp.AAC.1
MSAAARSAKKSQEAKAANDKADMQLVNACLKAHGAPAVTEAKRVLCQLGFIDEVTNQITPPATQVALAPPKAKAKPEGAGADWQASVGVTWDKCKVPFLREILTELHSVVLSEANLKSCGRKHAKDVPKAV